jgi:hypothetical protein
MDSNHEQSDPEFFLQAFHFLAIHNRRKFSLGLAKSVFESVQEVSKQFDFSCRF